MAESKYSLRLAAVDAYSSTFGDFKKKANALKEGLKAQQAELHQLNRVVRSVDGYAKLTEQIEGTKAALMAARVEQAKVAREYAGATAKVAQLTQAHAEAAAKHKELASSTEATTAQVRIARTEEARLAKELKGATTEVAKLDTAQDKATAGLRTLEAAQRGQRNELKRLQTELTAAGVDTGKLASEQKRLETATASANAALQAQRARLDAVKGAQGRVDENRGKRADLRGQMLETAALAYVASRPINQAMDLETSMADVGKVINFEGSGREDMAKANLAMASDRLIASSGMTAIDLAKIEYAAGQSGIGNDVKDKDGNVDAKGKTAAIMDFTRDAAIMGSAFDIDAQTAGETMAGWRASMGLNRAQTLDLADSTNYLGNNFNATAADIASVVKRYGAVGKASGMTPEQTAALSAAFLNPGTEKEIAGTGFKNFTAALTKGQAATKGQRNVWEKLGFDPEDLALQMQGNAPETIMTVLKAIKAEPVEEQAAIATQLFGSESIGAIQPLLQNLGEVQRAFDMVKDKTKYATSALGENGSMMQEAAGVANTSRTGWNSFTAKLTRLSTTIGTAMLPALNAIMTPLGAMVDGLSWAADKFPNITAAIAVAAGGLVALKMGALGLKYVGLLLGQGLNRGSLARAKLDLRTARTATAADMAVARLNGSIGRLGRGGVAGIGRRAGVRRRVSMPPDVGARRRRTQRVLRRSGAGPSSRRSSISPRGGVRGALSGAVARLANAVGSLGGSGAGLGFAAKGAGAAVGAGAAYKLSAKTKPSTAVGEPVKAPAALKAVKVSDSTVVSAELGASKAAPTIDAVVPEKKESLLSGAGSVVGDASEWAGDASEILGGRSGALGRVGSIAGKLATPLKLLSAGMAVVDGLEDGSAEGIGGGVGTAAGAIGGAWAGAAAGAAVGSVVPVIGTAIGGVLGGAIGGFAGSEAGSWLGEALGGLIDKLKSPEATAEQIVKSTTENSAPVNFSPQISIQPSGDPAYDKRMADDILARLKAELLPMMMGADSLAARRSASLSDGSE